MRFPYRALPALALLALAPAVSIAQEGSPAGPVPVQYLTARRAELLKRIGNGVAVIRSAEKRSIEGDYPQDSDYRENNDFFYLTGFEEPAAVAVLVPGRAGGEFILFCRERDPKMELWTGPRHGPRGARAHFGADEAHPADAIDESHLRGLRVIRRRRIFTWVGSLAILPAVAMLMPLLERTAHPELVIVVAVPVFLIHYRFLASRCPRCGFGFFTESPRRAALLRMRSTCGHCGLPLETRARK